MINPTIEPTDVRYIKLGAGGAWLSAAVTGGILPLGYLELDHSLCVHTDWAAAEHEMNKVAASPAAAKRHVLQVRDFYELPETALWFTLGNGHLWWTFAESRVIPWGDPPKGITRARRCIGGWSKRDLKGEPLTVAGLSSSLSKVQGYKGTICRVDAEEYLLRRIRGEAHPLHERASRLQSEIGIVAMRMIEELHWREFETFIDLIFMRGGWRRVSLLGETMPDVDLLVEQPLTGERAWVQIKSRSSQAELIDYIDRYHRDGSCARLFFACHSPVGEMRLPHEDTNIRLLVGKTLAELAISVGLFGWLVERTR